MPQEPHAARTATHAPLATLPQYWSDETSRRRFVDRLFDDTAASYDFVERLLGFGTGPWYRRDALARAGLAPGMRVLDIATGTGLVAREAASIAGPSGLVVGLDPSAGMLGEASRLGIPLVRGMGERLPFPDHSFDFVSMGFALRHVADLDVLFREIGRVLRPGGVACILEITHPKRAWAARPLRFFMTRAVPLLARALGRGSDGPRLMRFYWDTIEACVRPEAVMEALGRSGFAERRRVVSAWIFSEYLVRGA